MALNFYTKKKRKRQAKKIESNKGGNTKDAASIRIQSELDGLFADLQHNIEVIFDHKDPKKANLREFKVKIKVLNGWWKHGRYTFNFSVPKEYPIEAPKVTLKEKIYHPNIDTSGAVCLNILRNGWKPILSIEQVIHGLNFLFVEPNAKDPLNLEAAALLREQPKKFFENVKKSLRGQQVDGIQYKNFVGNRLN